MIGLIIARAKRFTPTRVGKTRLRIHSVSWAYFGSPPRVWGKRVDERVARRRQRFTPTRVGKTRVAGRSSTGLIGSPPRVWGKRPSCASTIGTVAVHPHACGENAGSDSRRANG